MTARRVVVLLVAACAVYLLLILQRALILIESGEALPVLLGLALLVIPVIGAWVVWRELQFGFRSEALAQQLIAEGALPVDDLPRLPSGRPEREAADARFVERREEAEQDRGNWRAWYRLALAYEDAGDRRRAREAVRRAIALHNGDS